jgi:predicted CXXCH cytochrome family protein
MHNCEITKITPIKGGRFMRKFTLIAVLTVVALLVFASFAMAAPGDYEPDTTSGKVYEDLTDTYTDGAGNTYTPGYFFLNPRARNATDPRQVMQADGTLIKNSDPLAPWNIFNANYTGETGVPYYGGGTFNTYQRNVDGQLVHTNFQLNTNSCASCHMTHTAQSRKLLFRNGVYTTCTACHDGTLGFLNVFAAPTVENPFGGSRTAGTFGADYGRNASVHLASGAVTISAAPGGNRMKAANVDGLPSGNSWSAAFTCGSCHGPHGSYSIRLLHANPNNISLRTRSAAASNAANSTFNTGGLYKVGMTLEAVADPTPYFKKFKIPTSAWTAGAAWYYGYPGGADMNASGRNPRYVTRIYPTVVDGVYAGTGINAFGVTGTGINILNKFISINYGGGYAYFKDTAAEDAFVAELQKFDNTATVDNYLTKIKIDAGGVIKITAGSTVPDTAANRYKSDFINTATYDGLVLQGTKNAPYNLYCAACHTDYLGASASGQSGSGMGVYSKAFRHTINRGATGGGTMQVKANGNNMLCLSCHFAHGVDSSFMSLANATLVKDSADSLQNDINTSSALKRYINMAVCWSCHANSSATTLKNSQWYWDEYGDGRSSW